MNLKTRGKVKPTFQQLVKEAVGEEETVEKDCDECGSKLAQFSRSGGVPEFPNNQQLLAITVGCQDNYGTCFIPHRQRYYYFII